MEKNTGKKLEMEVYAAVQALLESGDLGLIAENCRVFMGKAYYSKDREAKIVTDVSIELYLKKSETPSIIWIWECKDYNKAISVKVIEEFHSKLAQIGADKTKGTVITSRGAFQSGAVRYAGSKGIGLARLMPEEQVEWVMYQMVPGLHMGKYGSLNGAAISALVQKDYISRDGNFFALTGDSKFKSDSLMFFIKDEMKHILQENGN